MLRPCATVSPLFRYFDILVNNAGTNRPKPMVEVTVVDYDVVDSLNLKASFFVAQRWVATLSCRSAGQHHRYSSQMGHVGAANRTFYCASKHGLEGLTKAMAVELGPLEIRVNSIAPTFIETPMTRPFSRTKRFARAFSQRSSSGAWGSSRMSWARSFMSFPMSPPLSLERRCRVDGGWTAE